MTEYQRMLIAALQGQPVPTSPANQEGSEWSALLPQSGGQQINPRGLFGGAYIQQPELGQGYIPQQPQQISPQLNDAMNALSQMGKLR